MEDKEVESWTCEDVKTWLETLGFDSLVSKLLTFDHQIDGAVLLMLTEKDLRTPPLQLRRLGDIKRLIFHIRKLQALSCQTPSPPVLASKEHSPTIPEEDLNIRSRRLRQENPHRLGSLTRLRRDSIESEEVDLWRQNFTHNQRPSSSSSFNYDDIPLELWKTVLSFIYVFAVFMLTAFVMVVVHDRVPEMDKYPPLPDLFLDNMPHVPWAFDACELVGLTLGAMWFVLLFFHKHRFVLMRRFFSLMGTIFLLRCVTMLITSLSVPGKHLQCSGKVDEAVTKGKDTPRKYYYVHIMSWCLNLFGIFFLLAAHEHYSIDVFVAFYLSSRLFMYYHTLAHNRALQAADAKRTRIWFPLFAFFESKCEGRVPNTFAVPFRNPVQSFKDMMHYVTSRIPQPKATGSNLHKTDPSHSENLRADKHSENLADNSKTKLN
ncbi:sphingomyelin synthase-related 1 [Elysia marginata]|uniref:Sphingomyelin synthase-related 1 n=1 Tax=Elysia marginata TaxID=1093978 RepID=A0AAV4IZ21_9GAST|nr:sphingomyelin synthase-related 1 [Elysia marginata]